MHFSLSQEDYNKAKRKVRGSADFSKLAIGSEYENRVLMLTRPGVWYVKHGITISLPGLMLLGKKYNARRLYRFWCQTELLLVKRSHPWSSPARKAAARERKKHTGHWGHGRG